MGDNWGMKIMEYFLATVIPFTSYSYVKFTSAVLFLFVSYIIANEDICF